MGDGALAILQAVQESKRYPCNRGREGSPLWLRMENNHILWEPVFEKLAEWDFPWASGDSRDSWRKDSTVCPLVSMHRSYHHQTPSAGSGGQSGEGRSHGDWTRADDAWSEGGRSSSSIGGAGDGTDAAGSRWDGSGGKHRAAQWSRAEWEGWDPAPDEFDEYHYRRTADADFREFVQLSLDDAARVQVEKFNLIFSILHEIQERQGRLEEELTELAELQRQHQQQQQQGYAVQQMVDGSQWTADSHHFGGGVW